jgi:uncharacterized phage-like protein YoqJ
MLTAAITGHRPEKIPSALDTFEALKQAYVDTHTDFVIQGMAAGVDLIAAYAAFKSGIPYICAKPWAGHKPRKQWKPMYLSAEKNAARIVNVHPGETYPGVWAYQKRNEWMVDNSDILIAVWDGSTGGTKNCVDYALKHDHRIWLIDPLTGTGDWFSG